jgi:cytosol alanyl aminopeptidase
MLCAFKTIVSFFLAASGVTTPDAGSTPPAAPPPKGAHHHLASWIKPLHYSVRLTIVPAEESFHGLVDVDLALQQDAAVIWLNAEDLSVISAEARYTDHVAPATGARTRKGQLGFTFEHPIPRGAVSLHIDYTGKIRTGQRSGIFRLREGADWYAFAHLEPSAARRVFPCFDEPSIKTPWQLSLKVHGTDQAFSNTPAVSETEAGDGFKLVQFADTKPLPSHLVGFAVGPIDLVPASPAGSDVSAIRILAPRGEGADSRWAAEATPQILAHLGRLSGVDYLFGELAFVVLPLSARVGFQMPGLIAMDEARSLVPSGREGVEFQRRLARAAAGLLAHQWFGDLVTPVGWDDAWLSEALSQWIASRAVEEWQPTWRLANERPWVLSEVLDDDSLVASRSIRREADGDSEERELFDDLDVRKGAVTLAMFEKWIGSDKLHGAIQHYLKGRAYQNASASDFIETISDEAGNDIGPALSSFWDQPGVPRVSFEVRCHGGAAPVVSVKQDRYFPLGADANRSGGDQLWQIPVCLRWGSPGSTNGRLCNLLGSRDTELTLPELEGCPEWLLPNEGGVGYYRAELGGDWLNRLLRTGFKQLTIPERIAVAGDVRAQVRAGRLPINELIALIPKLSEDPNRSSAEVAIDLAAGLRDDGLIPESVRPKYAHFIRDTFGRRAHQLGWVPKKSDDEDTRLLRARLVQFVADAGEDSKLIDEAKRLASAWLDDPASISPDIVDAVLATAAEHGDRSLFDALHRAATAAKSKGDALHALRAMARFRDPDVVRGALPIALSDEFEPAVSFELIRGATHWAATRLIAYEFVKANFDVLSGRLPEDMVAHLPDIGATLCDGGRRSDVESFFKERNSRFPDGPHCLARALERMQVCSAIREKQAPAVATFLSRR